MGAWAAWGAWGKPFVRTSDSMLAHYPCPYLIEQKYEWGRLKNYWLRCGGVAAVRRCNPPPLHLSPQPLQRDGGIGDEEEVLRWVGSDMM